MTMGGLFNRFRPNRPDPEDAARVKAWVRNLLALPEDAIVTVSEIACADPACPGLETVILVMRPGEKAFAYKSTGSLVTQTRPQLEQALSTQNTI